MTKPAKLTDNQRKSLANVARAHKRGAWYRAGQADPRYDSHGEAVTLASLYYRSFLTRQKRPDSHGYEYRLDPTMVEALTSSGVPGYETTPIP